jgi:hypothetical protein
LQHYPAALRGLSGQIAKSFLPERQHLLEFIAADNNRADSHIPSSSIDRNPGPDTLEAPLPDCVRVARNPTTIGN